MDPIVVRALTVAIAVVVLAIAGRWWQARDGQVRVADEGATVRRDHLDVLGLDLRGAVAGAVLLGSPTCTPCTAVKRVLRELADEQDGFRWVYADAAAHLPLAEEHKVFRVPTLFLLDPTGKILARTSGVPKAADLRQVLAGHPVDGLAA